MEETMTAAVRNTLGRALRQAHLEKIQVADKVKSMTAALKREDREERELARLDDLILDLSNALGDEEAARWDID